MSKIHDPGIVVCDLALWALFGLHSLFALTAQNDMVTAPLKYDIPIPLPTAHTFVLILIQSLPRLLQTLHSTL